MSTTGQRGRSSDESSGGNEERVEKIRLAEMRMRMAALERENRGLVQAKMEAEERLLRYAALFEHAPVGCLTLDRRGAIVEVNQSGASLFGTDRARLTGKRIELFLSVESRAAFSAFLAEMFDSGRRMFCEVEASSKEGAPLAIELVGMSLEDGRASHLVATDITERKRIVGEMERSREELRNLAARLLSVREDERTALARELHDNLGQLLAAMKFNLAWLRRSMKCVGDPEKRKAIRAKALELGAFIDDAIATVRQTAGDLRPAVLSVIGFWPAIEAETARFTARTGIACAVEPCGSPKRPYTDKVSIAVFRIVQEALTNIALHAKADTVRISCTASEDGHTLSIIDDGSGIDEAELSSPNSLGLIGMRERARTFGGELAVLGVPGSGTTVAISIPIRHARRGP